MRKCLKSRQLLSTLGALGVLLLWAPGALADPRCARVLAHYERVHPRATWEYDWTTAIFLYGAVTYTQRFAQAGWEATALERLFGELRARAPAVTMPDLASMSLPATLVHTPAALELRRLSEEFFRTEPRNALGAIDHVGARHRFAWFLPPTHWFSASALWADSMIMTVLNGFRLAQLRGDEDGMAFFLGQVELFHRHLRDERSGLYKHAYYLSDGARVPRTGFWARGNLWIDLGLIELLAALPPGHAARARLTALLLEHLRALQRVPTTQGLHTLLDDEESYVETSATALLAYVLKKAQRLNLIDESFTAWQHALTAVVLSRVEGDSLTGVSGPTTAFPYAFYYKHLVQPRADLSYGVGAFLLLCSELD